ncbi:MULTISPECIES: ROK family transcriptional regulator [Micromonospora]|uniref:ROK family transcriptional regulator n=1 Tax=Micromonospora solifontis TaxID=2487138 RepID=A0ABX9WJ56_9ACTN|nr:MULTISPECIES: ROK family transcriptional regulator [Micromonospora]NES15563.1 ROK family transcriptional regulator [Micromonospora sp. PPF5-17B]NES35932.1 ROK family transcriptional regulator [Micromonospora solifontis]NES56902.1 ROK family transcriptional regulator [Micromonospora sp. PPF5-6]RNM00217.1 ROK family transcriptional regulator [Micromonospora solifontis]
MTAVWQCQGVTSTSTGAVRQGSLRELNLAVVLRRIAAADRPPSRADLAAATGLTRATVSAVVDDLIAGRLVTEADPAPRAGAGRPARGLVLAADGPAGLGLEVNVDYLAACVVDLTGTVRHHLVRRADLRPVSPADTLDRLAALAAEARAAAVREGLTLAGAALAVPGLVSDGGLVRLAPNLGWRDVDVPRLLGGRPLAEPVDGIPPLVVDNEANLAALGELHAGPPGSASFLHVSGEIGIGAGIVLDGALYRGARGWSGEIGHIPVDPRGRTCRCGGQGCLERYAGQEAILAAAGLPGADLPADTAAARLADLAAAGDPATLTALTDAGTALGVAVAGVVNLLDLDTVVLGGGYAPLARWLSPPVVAEVSRRVLTAAWAPVTVRPAALGAQSAAVGGAASVIRRIIDRPVGWLARSG